MTRYGRYTHLDDMSALTQWTKDAVYHNITVLETAKPRKEILNTVAETFPAYDVLVLWSRKEYELFRQAMHDCGHRLCTAKVVLLEELLVEIAEGLAGLVGRIEDPLLHAQEILQRLPVAAAIRAIRSLNA